ncbi:hypothetical protein BJX99DRAFT_259742 [Aspergillus californicus]
MHSFRSLLSLSLITLLISSTSAKTTTIGIETEEASRGVTVPMDDCFEIDEWGPFCTGRNTLLQPGEHSTKEGVLIGSVLCEEPDIF